MECGLGPSTSYYYYYYHWKVLVGNRPHGKVNYLGWAVEYVALGAAGCWLWQSVSSAVLQRTATHTEDHVKWAAIILVGRTF